MRLKIVCLCLLTILFLLFLNEIACISNRNLISDEDHRGSYEPASDTYSSEYGKVPSPGYYYYPSDFSHSSGYGLTGHESHGYGFTAQEGHHPSSSHGHGSHHNALALKGLLIPLAGIALLGAAAALSTNPVLLQLGVVNGRRRRRRRSVPDH